jgi:hypothetical protein
LSHTVFRSDLRRAWAGRAECAGAGCRDQLAIGRQGAARKVRLATRSQGGDLGVIWNGTDGFNNAVWPSVETLRVGQVTRAPVKTAIGYILAQLVSTSANPLPSDKAMYSARAAQYRQGELNHGIKQLLDQLHAQATISRYAFN